MNESHLSRKSHNIRMMSIYVIFPWMQHHFIFSQCVGSKIRDVCFLQSLCSCSASLHAQALHLSLFPSVFYNRCALAAHRCIFKHSISRFFICELCSWPCLSNCLRQVKINVLALPCITTSLSFQKTWVSLIYMNHFEFGHVWRFFKSKTIANITSLFEVQLNDTICFFHENDALLIVNIECQEVSYLVTARHLLLLCGVLSI